LQATADGDQEAFRIFVDAHKNKVLRICFGFVRNREEAEDIAQEVFFKVYRGASGFRGRSAVSTWLYRITVNCSLNHIRKAKSKAWPAWTNPSVGADELDYIAGSDEPADLALERHERRKLLRDALDKLPHNQRTAFTLHGIEGLSYEEISRIMDCSLSAVESRIHRAKLNLKKHLTRALKKRKMIRKPG
jgi:RNA polymerase sigma-70 factor (ECF subfamily)